MSYQEHPYKHPVHKPGQIVHVSDTVRDIHPESPVAGKDVEVCTGIYYTSGNPGMAEIIRTQERIRHHETFVPVAFGGEVWFVEEEYISSVPQR